eukprot:Skav212466  [mRNA]  locus=scaffold385:287546:307274:- [translate_table: standard]
MMDSWSYPVQEPLHPRFRLTAGVTRLQQLLVMCRFTLNGSFAEDVVRKEEELQKDVDPEPELFRRLATLNERLNQLGHQLIAGCDGCMIVFDWYLYHLRGGISSAFGIPSTEAMRILSQTKRREPWMLGDEITQNIREQVEKVLPSGCAFVTCQEVKVVQQCSLQAGEEPEPRWAAGQKAALNMMTRTCAEDLAMNSGIYMNSVDTGWINDENPLPTAQRIAESHNFQTPIDEIDAAARIVDPVLLGIGSIASMGRPVKRGAMAGGLDGEGPPWGWFLKDYVQSEPWRGCRERKHSNHSCICFEMIEMLYVYIYYCVG